MTNDTPADVATEGSAPTPNPTTKTTARTKKAAAAEKAPRPTRTKSQSTAKSTQQKDPEPKSTPKTTQQEDPEPGPSGSDASSDSSTSDGDQAGFNMSDSEYEEDPSLYQPFKVGADPFSPEWYRTNTRTCIEETLNVPGSHRILYPRPFDIRDSNCNRTLANCSTGARQ
jgi:hypothetical protein